MVPPLLLLPLALSLPPPVMTTVTFFLSSIGLQTLVPGSMDVILLFESFSQVPHGHLVASASLVPPAP